VVSFRIVSSWSYLAAFSPIEFTPHSKSFRASIARHRIGAARFYRRAGICGEPPTGVDVNRPLRIAAMDAAAGVASLVEGALGRVWAASEGHSRVVNIGQLRGEHGLDLIARLDPRDEGEHGIRLAFVRARTL